MTTLYISPTGAGLRDGSSIENAGTLGNLNSFIKSAGAGGEVLLIADKGSYQQNTQLGITSGGGIGAPVTVRGVDSYGNPMAAEIVGSRPAAWAPGMSQGNELFRLLSGANNLVFEDLTMRNFGNGVFRAGADISNLTIRDVNAFNVSRFVEDYVSGTATSATINGLTVQNVNVTGYSSGAIRLQYDTHNVVIENTVGDSQHQDGGLYVFGLALDGTAHDILVSHVTMKNNYGNGTASEYWNGDGFMAERGVYNLRFEDTISSGNTDAGYDLKSSNTVLVGTISDGNKRNYRFWSDSITMEDGVSLNPTLTGGNSEPEHIWLDNGAVVTIDHLAYSDASTPKTLFDLSKGDATLHLLDTPISALYQNLVRLGSGSVIDTNAAPTGIAISGGTVEENAAAGTCVATLSAIDLDAADSHSFALVGGATDVFELAGCEIRVKAGAVLDFEAQSSYALTVSATDQCGLSCTQTITIDVLNVVETGTSGNDTLTGGAGADQLAGGAGNDTYLVNLAGDVVVELAGQGIDLVQTNLTAYTLGANIENLAFVGIGPFAGTGNGLSNAISGGASGDTLRGGVGADSISGGDGADTVYGGSDNDTLWGNTGDDLLLGEGGRDHLYGSTGNDRLNGGSGSDTLAGGAGDDTYVVDAAGDTITEKSGEGVDTVESTVSRTLGSYVENLTLTGGAATSGTGNGLANRIVGNGAANILNGGAGNDTLDGGAGSDTLVGGQGADTYRFGRGSGVDMISNNDTDLGADVLALGAGIATDQVWFARSGDDLVVSVLGTADRATLQGWYADANNQLDRFELADGTSLAAAQVQQLVDAMSSFTTPPSDLSTLTAAQQQSIETAIAANWHSAG